MQCPTSKDFLIRDARIQDLDSIYSLSTLLNTVNLPANKNNLEQVLINSEKSFSLKEKDSTKRTFLFVLTDPDNRVVGTSQIFAKHGTLSCPHHYFQIEIDERYSETLQKYFRHKTLRLCHSFDGPTELGSLVLDTNYRSGKAKLGSLLSYVRFLFMAMRKDFFSDQVIAELLPPLGENLKSTLWEAIGRKFTGLDYYEADMLSRENKEFIKTLFPAEKIYVSILPKDAQEIIGQIGDNSKGAAHLLSKIGFYYSNRVDPFDGGPHFEALQKDITLINNTQKAVVKESGVAEKLTTQGLCGYYNPEAKSGERFLACRSNFFFDDNESNIYLNRQTINILKLAQQDHIYFFAL